MKIRTSANVNLLPALKRVYFDGNGQNQLSRANGGPLELVSAIFGPFDYSSQTAKIYYSALSNSAKRSTTQF
jgi:hypothetical protein